MLLLLSTVFNGKANDATILTCQVKIYCEGSERATENVRLIVKKIKQERTRQDRTRIGSFSDFLLHFSTFLLEIFSMALQLNYETMLKILIMKLC